MGLVVFLLISSINSAVVISFGDGKNYYCVDEKTFTLMQEALSELEE